MNISPEEWRKRNEEWEKNSEALQAEMRDATKEERDSVNKYIKSISHDTGVKFDDLMTLDEVIIHAEKVADGRIILDSNDEKECKRYAEEHRQLAEWLKDYKRLREKEQPPCGDAVSRSEVSRLIYKYHRLLVRKNRKSGHTEINKGLFYKLLKKLPTAKAPFEGMTNGEAISAVLTGHAYISTDVNGRIHIRGRGIDVDWLNAPYGTEYEEQESEEQE